MILGEPESSPDSPYRRRNSASTRMRVSHSYRVSDPIERIVENTPPEPGKTSRLPSTAESRGWVAPDGSWASSAAIRRTMLANRSRDTVPETALRSLVHRAGLRFRVATPPVKGSRRTADGL